MSINKIAKMLLVICAGSLRAEPAAAQEPAPSESAFFEELPIVSVSRLPQTPTNTPGAVTVFDHDFIRATGYRDIYRTLKLVPGMLAVTEYGHTPLKIKPWASADLIYGHAFVRIKSNDPSPQRIYDAVNSVPPYSYSVTWLQRYPYDISTTATLYGVGSMVWSGLDPTPGYRSVDARVAKMLKLDGVRFELALNALNLGPRRQEYGFHTVYTPPDPTISRIVFGSARADF